MKAEYVSYLVVFSISLLVTDVKIYVIKSTTFFIFSLQYFERRQLIKY